MPMLLNSERGLNSETWRSSVEIESSDGDVLSHTFVAVVLGLRTLDSGNKRMLVVG